MAVIHYKQEQCDDKRGGEEEDHVRFENEQKLPLQISYKVENAFNMFVSP